MGVWDSNYKAVWHLPNGTTLTGNDSTANTFNLTLNGSPTASAGKIYGGATFNGTWGQNAVATGGAALTPGNAGTLDFWMNPTSWVVGADVMSQNVGGSGTALVLQEGTSVLVIYLQSTTYNSGFAVGIPISSIPVGAWSHVAVTWNGSSLAGYVNGTLAYSQTMSAQSATTSTGNFNIAGEGYNYWAPVGIDEMRVSNIGRSAGWIATEYNNQNSPSTFYTTGTQQ